MFGQQKLQPVCQVEAIESVNDIEDLECGLRLVALQRSDEMPSGSRHLWFLCHRLLHPVFTEIRGARPHSFADNFRREGLSDRDQCDGSGISSAGCCGISNASLHIGQPLRHSHCHARRRSAVAAADLIRRMFTQKPGTGCGCSCTSCIPDKNTCAEQKSTPAKRD